MNEIVHKLNDEQLGILSGIIDEEITKSGKRPGVIAGEAGIIPNYVSAARNPVYIATKIPRVHLELLLTILRIETDNIFTDMTPKRYESLRQGWERRIKDFEKKVESQAKRGRKKKPGLESKKLDPPKAIQKKLELPEDPPVPEPDPCHTTTLRDAVEQTPAEKPAENVEEVLEDPTENSSEETIPADVDLAGADPADADHEIPDSDDEPEPDESELEILDGAVNAEDIKPEKVESTKEEETMERAEKNLREDIDNIYDEAKDKYGDTLEKLDDVIEEAADNLLKQAKMLKLKFKLKTVSSVFTETYSLKVDGREYAFTVHYKGDGEMSVILHTPTGSAVEIIHSRANGLAVIDFLVTIINKAKL